MKRFLAMFLLGVSLSVMPTDSDAGARLPSMRNASTNRYSDGVHGGDQFINQLYLLGAWDSCVTPSWDTINGGPGRIFDDASIDVPLTDSIVVGTAAAGLAGGILADTTLTPGLSGLAPNVEASYGLAGAAYSGSCQSGGSAFVDVGGVADNNDSANISAGSYNELTVLLPEVGPSSGTLKGTLSLSWNEDVAMNAILTADLDGNRIRANLGTSTLFGYYQVGNDWQFVWDYADPLGGGLTVFPEYDTAVDDIHTIEATLEGQPLNGLRQPIAGALGNGSFNFIAQSSYYIE